VRAEIDLDIDVLPVLQVEGRWVELEILRVKHTLVSAATQVPRKKRDFSWIFLIIFNAAVCQKGKNKNK
jgi:hypothetical protein